jgi:hypothetical protein
VSISMSISISISKQYYHEHEHEHGHGHEHEYAIGYQNALILELVRCRNRHTCWYRVQNDIEIRVLSYSR